MAIHRKLVIAALTMLLTVSVVGARWLVSAAGVQDGNPCPASWFPLSKEPYSIQRECGQLRDQARQARPRPSVIPPPPTADAASLSGPSVLAGYVPDEDKTTKAVSFPDAFNSNGNHWNPVTSVWQVGVVLSPNHQGYARLIVYAVGPASDVPVPYIFRWLQPPDGPMPDVHAQWDASWKCPRPLGNLSIAGISGQTGIVSFTSDSRVSGTLNMATGAWAFSQ